MEIRHYESGDREQVVSLWDSVFPGTTGHNDSNDSISRKVKSDDGLFFVAIEGATVIGTVLAGYDGHRGWLYSLAVDPDWQRNRVGSQLVRRAEEALKDLGCPKLNLQILADNSEVVAFYESLGFKVEERISMGKLMTD